MAITTQESDQLGSAERLWQNELGGKLSMAYVSYTQVGAGDANSSVAAVKLPAGRVRFIGGLSKLPVMDWPTVDVGWDEYVDINGDTVAADPDGLDDGIALAVSAVSLGTAQAATADSYLFESQAGVTLRFTCTAAVTDGESIAGVLVYVKES